MSGGLAVVELGEADLGVGVDEGLLVDASDALERPDVEGVLGAAVARAFGDEFAMGLLVGLGFFQGRDLRLGEDQAVLSHLRLERLEPMFHGLQVVAQPDRAHAEGRDRHSLLGHFVRHPRLAPGRLVDRHGHHGRFDLGQHPGLQDRLAARHLLKRQFPAFVVEILEPVEAVPAVAHDLAGLADAAELLGQIEQAGLGANDLLILGHRCLLEPPWRGLRNPDQLRPRHGSRPCSETPSVRLS